jgi:hypothetical protein
LRLSLLQESPIPIGNLRRYQNKRRDGRTSTLLWDLITVPAKRPLEGFIMKRFVVTLTAVLLLSAGFAYSQSVTIEVDGSSWSSGVYFYKVKADNFTDTRKMVLLK